MRTGSESGPDDACGQRGCRLDDRRTRRRAASLGCVLAPRGRDRGSRVPSIHDLAHPRAHVAHGSSTGPSQPHRALKRGAWRAARPRRVAWPRGRGRRGMGGSARGRCIGRGREARPRYRSEPAHFRPTGSVTYRLVVSFPGAGSSGSGCRRAGDPRDHGTTREAPPTRGRRNPRWADGRGRRYSRRPRTRAGSSVPDSSSRSSSQPPSCDPPRLQEEHHIPVRPTCGVRGSQSTGITQNLGAKRWLVHNPSYVQAISTPTHGSRDGPLRAGVGTPVQASA